MWGGDASENDARFEETLEIILKGLQCEFLSHSGQFYNFKELWMELRPCQQPLPPFWYAGNAAHAGERGMNFVGGERVPLAGIRELMEQYVTAFKQSPAQGFAGRDEPLYGAIKRVYVAASDDEARERARLAYASYRTHFLKPLPGGRVDPEEIPRPAKIDVDTAFASGALVVGSPATIREYLQRYVTETGANYFVGSFHWGDLSHKEACRSLELFASEAMPAVP
jgi:alkanesulfonate monooxygenase SsuD/methylene tetrahydromethanopterin reductase-like flavin-dependent oxidoreductase (luciferase family)